MLASKATETKLKAKLPSAQLAANEDIGSPLACMSGSKIEIIKAKRDLLDSTKSLAKALKAGSGSVKKVQLLEKANVDLQNDLAASLKLKDTAKQMIDKKKQLGNQLDAKHQLRLSLAKIDLKIQKVALSCKQEKKRKRDDVHKHCLTEIVACEASSKGVKDTAASKTRIKEQALETLTQQVQTMLKTYQGTNSGHFPNGCTSWESVSSRTANWACLLKTATSPYFSSSVVTNRLSPTLVWSQGGRLAPWLDLLLLPLLLLRQHSSISRQ
jgi:hypothetical protein